MKAFMHMQLLASAVELIVNQALTAGQCDKAKLAKLSQKSLAVVLAEFSGPIVLTVVGEKVLVSSPKSMSEPIDCTINTSLKSLVQLKNEQQLTQLIKDDELVIDGDMKVIKQFLACMESLSIDWQIELEKHLGDIATYKLVQLGKAVGEKLNFAKQQISADASEWLIHEQKLAVTAYEINDYKEQVESVNQGVAQLATKLEAITNRLTTLTSKTGR